MIAMAFIPLAWVERGGGMVQVEVLEGFLNTDASAHGRTFLSLILSTVIYLALAWFTLKDWPSAITARAHS